MNRLLFIFLISLSLSFAQTTISVGGASSGWTAVTVSPDSNTTVYMSDPSGDQQTGQGADDFVGTTTSPGMFIDFGTVGGAQSIGFRFYMNRFESGGFSGNLRVGIDADGNGDVDIFLGPRLGGSAANQGIVFQNPGTGLNVSPSTTSLGTNYGRIAFTADNYNYQQLTSAIDPTWTTVGTDADSVLSFSIPFANLQTALSATGVVIDSTTFLSFIAFSSTQSSAINQDLYGSTGINATTRFDAPDGGFTDYYNANGEWRKRPIVPEPSAYGAMFMSLILSFFIYRRRARRA